MSIILELFKEMGGYLIIVCSILVFLLWIYYAKRKILPLYYKVQNDWHKLDSEINLFLEVLNDFLQEITTTLGFTQQIITDISKNRKWILLSPSPDSKSIGIIKINEKLFELEIILRNLHVPEKKPNILVLINNLYAIKKKIYELQKNYNNSVEKYNFLIFKFPYNLPANVLGLIAFYKFKLENDIKETNAVL